MKGIKKAGEKDRPDLPSCAPPELPHIIHAETARTVMPAENLDLAVKKTHLDEFCSNVLTTIGNVDRRLCYMFGMLLSILHPIIALYVVTYKECHLDDLGKPIPNYKPPEPCALDANGEKEDPDCIDPPEAYARIENICYMYLANEFALHTTYVLYVKVWALGGRSVGIWRELIGYASYFVVEFLINAAGYHVQTFPDFREVFPFLNNFTWPLYAAFIVGSILLLPLGVFLARTRDQTRRALTFHLPGIVFFGVDIFNRTVFLPFFETMQHKFAQLELHEFISFIVELALANFYGSIFLPATHKATIVFAEFGYNVSYQTGNELPTEEDVPNEILPQESEDGVRVLLDLDSPSGSDTWRQFSKDDTPELGLGLDHQNPHNDLQYPAKAERVATWGEEHSREGKTNQPGILERSATGNHQRGARTFEQQSRSSRVSSKSSTFTSATRRSRLLAPIVAPVDYIPPSGPHVPIRPDGPDPLEFDKILCWLSIVWDAWRYLLIRTVLMKASSIWLYLLMIVKDFSFSYWHFGYAFMERRVLSVIEGASNEDRSMKQQIGNFLFKLFQLLIVRPFFLTKFLATTVWRTEIIFGMNEKRQKYSQSVYEESRMESQSSRLSFRQTIKHAGGRMPTASDWAIAFSTVAAEKGRHTRGFVSSLCNDLWTHLVLNVRRDWRHWKAKAIVRYKHPVEHWKKRLTASRHDRKTAENQKLEKRDDIEVRYCFANECVIIRHVPPKPKTPKNRSTSKILTRTEDVYRPSGHSVFRRINAAWLSKVVKEIQSLIFNRCWPRLLQKLMSSSVFLATELYTQHSIVGLLPSYQEYGLFKDVEGRFRVLFMFCIDVVEVSAVWYTQTQSRFYQSITKGYNLFHNLPMILLCMFNCAAQIMNFAMLRYIRFAPVCGDKRVLPDNVQQEMLKNLNLVKYWNQPDV